jgi:DNA invertase Pin-like site-specific DNA recombinase
MHRVYAIANCRVSSDEQKKSGSLDRQEKSVIQAAKNLDADIIKCWSGGVSSKAGTNITRTDLEEMLDLCKNNNQIKYAIFDELDRFMRSILEIGYFLVKFKSYGVKVVFASQPNLKTDTAADTLLLMLEAYKAEGSNEERHHKSISGQTAALKEGRYPSGPKPGYIKGHRAAVQELHPVRGPILRATLLDIATKRVTPTDALIAFNKSDFTKNHSPYRMDKFRKIVTDSYYAGIVEMHKQVDVRNENGLHEPLITIDQHDELKRIMNDKKKVLSGPRKNGNPKYPCNNLVICDLCLDKKNCRVVGYDHGNGKPNSTLVYEKYRCRECMRRISRQELHLEVKQRFEDNPISDEGLNDLIESLKVVWKQREGRAIQDANRIKAKIEYVNQSIDQQVEAATDPANTAIRQEILAAIAKKKDEVIELEVQLEKLTHEAADDKEDFLRFAFDFVEDMGSKFFDISEVNRLRCKQVIFPAGFYWNAKNKVYTPEISPLIRLAATKKDAETSINVQMVQQVGKSLHLIRDEVIRWRKVLKNPYQENLLNR